MGLFRKQTDPISERARTLNSEIAALEAQIKRLNSKVPQRQGRLEDMPTVKSDPQGNLSTVRKVPPPRSRRDPIFESVNQHPVNDATKSENQAVSQADWNVGNNRLERSWRTLTRTFRKPPTSNPKLVSYLAAGSIKGLRPLRYEKRIARNRTIALSFILILLLWGVYAAFVRQN